MPLNLSDNLGPKLDLASGRWIPLSETYLEGQTASLTNRRFITAQVSDIYLVRVGTDCTSNATAGTVLANIGYFSYGAGVGRQLTIQTLPMAVSSLNVSSCAWLLIRAANSDIFISTTVTQNGAAPTFNLYASISRPS